MLAGQIGDGSTDGGDQLRVLQVFFRGRQTCLRFDQRCQAAARDIFRQGCAIEHIEICLSFLLGFDG
jgi:hypothetical protein